MAARGSRSIAATDRKPGYRVDQGADGGAFGVGRVQRGPPPTNARKYGCVLRIETTINDVSFFKHHRKVEHRQGPPTRVLAPVKKTIYSLIDLREIMFGCNRRYLAHLAALDDFSAGVRALDRLTKPRTVEQKTIK